MAIINCAHCGFQLGHVNDACPQCLPSFYSKKDTPAVTTPTQSTPLKACPFCPDDGHPVLRRRTHDTGQYRYEVHCLNCGCIGPDNDTKGDMWQCRADAPQIADDEYAKALEEIHCALDNAYYKTKSVEQSAVYCSAIERVRELKAATNPTPPITDKVSDFKCGQCGTNCMPDELDIPCFLRKTPIAGDHIVDPNKMVSGDILAALDERAAMDSPVEAFAKLQQSWASSWSIDHPVVQTWASTVESALTAPVPREVVEKIEAKIKYYDDLYNSGEKEIEDVSLASMTAWTEALDIIKGGK